MLEGLQFDPPHNVFHGVRFLLAGFDPINKSQVYSKLVDCGGVNVDQYCLHCTHVIVDKLTYDDPLCVAARKDGKILVNRLWVAHSFDVGVPVDPTSIIYRPPRDLNGIPGAKSLLVCLTGYQRQDRDDIMTMVSLMGANFSKPLVANKVTHLICYKFEGDKYVLAKRTNRIKLVNHLWLEDCLKAWKLVPEADYNKSGYELEVLEAEAKDSEEETDISSKKNQLLIPKQEFKMNPLDPTPLKGLSTAINADDNASANREDRKVHHDPHVSESHLKESEVLDFCGAEALRHVSSDKPVASCDRVAFPHTVGNDFASTSGKERCPYSDARKSSPKRYDSEFSKGTMPSICPREMEGNMRKPELVNSVDLDAIAGVDIMTADPKNRTDIGCFRTPTKHVVPREEQCDKVNGNMTCKAQRSDRSSTPLVSASTLEMDRSETFKPASSPGCPTEMRRLAACRTPGLETSNTELSKDAELDEAFQISPMVSDETRKNNPDVIRRQESFTSEPLKISPLRRSDTKKSNAPLNLSLHADAQVEPPVKKFGRKSWTKGGASNVKGSIYLSNSAPHSANSINVGEKTSNAMVPAEINNADLEEAERKDLQPENKLQQTHMSVDDDTEALEDNAGYDPREVVIEEKNGEVKADIKQNNDILEHPQRQKSSSYTEPLGEQNNGFKRKETTCGNQKLGGSAASHNETCHQEKDGARQLEATSGKRKLDESSPMQIAAKAYTRSSGKRLSSKTKKTEASEAHRGNEFLNAVGEGNGREVELGLIENYEEDKYKEAHTELKSTTSGKRKVVESSNLENIGKDNKKVVKKCPLSKTNKRKVPTLSSTADMKEVSIEEADKEMSVDDIPHATEDQKNNESNNELDKSTEGEKENRPVRTVDQNVSHDKNVRNLTSKAVNNFGTRVCKSNFNTAELQRTREQEPVRFILSGHKLQRKEFQKVIRQLKGKLCRDTHQWSYQATHFIVPDPIRRTEKFFAAAASGRWILKTDYLSDSSRAGHFLAEESYEWHKSGLSEDGAINLEAPRKWRLQKERTGHGAFYGMNVIIYGECFVPPLDTLKRAIKAGEGTILATSPPYTRFLGSGVDFAVVSPGMPHVDIWVQEFLRHEIPCVAVDYLVEFVCKPGYNLERHVLYNTHAWAEKSFKNVISRCEETAEPETPLRDGGESAVPCEEVATPAGGIEHDLPCQVCGSRDRGEEMLICGNENGTIGCGIGTHIDCCDPPLPDVPMEDWFCPKCRKKTSSKKPKIAAKKTIAAKRSAR